MNDIDKILDNLQGQKPNVPNAEELTESIMANLPDNSTLKTRKTPKTLGTVPTWIVVLRTVSSIAAIWLIGLFIFDFVQSSNTDVTNTNNLANLSQGSTINVVRRCCLEKTNTLSYTQLKRMINENR